MAFKKEFNFKTHPWESIMFFDIETVRGSKSLKEDSDEYAAFSYKMRYDEEAQRKNFNVNYMKALYNEKAALYPEFGKIVAISMGKIVDGKLVVFSFSGHDEKTILVKFNNFIRDKVAEDPNFVLCGANIKVFDLRYIYVRSIVHQIEPVAKQIEFTGLKPWEINVFDLTDIWKQGSFYSAPVIAMAYALGLPSPKDDIDGSKVSGVYHDEEGGLERITHYCEKDVLTNANIARRLRLEPLVELDLRQVGKKTNSIQKSPQKAKLPPLLVKTFNTGQLTKVDEELLVKKTRKSTKPEKDRLLNIIQAIQGKEPLDEAFTDKLIQK